ncbi:MAG: DUF1223 domain-containing protein [Xanthomonadales bacterium]|jgi:hypothetical protein|nr:DUF1223 domain-containing protein [Xanthomonadales bacterium]
MKRHPTLIAIVLLLLAFAGPGHADSTDRSIEVSSGQHQVTLVELYTSEGCSSCPPADRWMSRFLEDPRLWRDVVPVSFHVDYWDWIGWQDRFAKPAWSERQRRHVREGNGDVVYTPGFFANGREWRGFFSREPLEPTRPRTGELRLQIRGRDVSAQFAPSGVGSDDLMLHVAVLGMNLESRVAAGENRGKLLQHDFVVLGLSRRALDRDEGGYRGELRLPPQSEDAGAVAAWVTVRDRLRPLQAVGGYLR